MGEAMLPSELNTDTSTVTINRRKLRVFIHGWSYDFGRAFVSGCFHRPPCICFPILVANIPTTFWQVLSCSPAAIIARKAL